MLFKADAPMMIKVLANPLLANNAAVRDKQAYAAGFDTFRLGYFSSLHLPARLAQQHPAQR
ncbi:MULTISPECIES: hypothetical protein [Chromobacterium]|uniref:Uncharacterized protein n=1 Tax=Chromobacterium rhizoryzae TaxID=1778675 RepID=A0AAD0RVF0_9NEIS|nr:MULTISPECIES: hypothetical protein [Chromobacterium]AXT48663.1 hypothetical protein D1345_21960 [Chromobacterium rhizoryzae]PTU69955.1 hypothetical protein DBB33_11160 [Chromobacterium haemolyticum]QOD82643.1 hypothetical protein IEZ30_22760 [Chromobacterium haemolyticum]